MVNEIKLGELEFTAEDFAAYNSLQHQPVSKEAYTSIIADAVNRILREKLGRAPILYNQVSSTGLAEIWHKYQVSHSTHSAYLVCVESIEK